MDFYQALSRSDEEEQDARTKICCGGILQFWWQNPQPDPENSERIKTWTSSKSVSCLLLPLSSILFFFKLITALILDSPLASHLFALPIVAQRQFYPSIIIKNSYKQGGLIFVSYTTPVFLSWLPFSWSACSNHHMTLHLRLTSDPFLEFTKYVICSDISSTSNKRLEL